jgi:hypothetical protein
VYDLCDDCEVPIIEEIEHVKLMAARIETGVSSFNIKGNAEEILKDRSDNYMILNKKTADHIFSDFIPQDVGQKVA